ncbi:MAG: hypothetical protein KDE56_18875 [Anaerolineales bacterium]|nr:hypothetical protein [Anaerolineales bacterium]
MNRLEQAFKAQADFFHFNVDRHEFDAIREELGLFRRTTYILLDSEGNEIRTWIGPLDEQAMGDQLTELLADYNAN